MNGPYKWIDGGFGYEISTRGDHRFSAMCATLSDGRTIEEHYQCDFKGYRNVPEGKGKPPLKKEDIPFMYFVYLNLWGRWAKENVALIDELALLAAQHDFILSDMFANTEVNQARALAEILNNYNGWILGHASIKIIDDTKGYAYGYKNRLVHINEEEE